MREILDRTHQLSPMELAAGMGRINVLEFMVERGAQLHEGVMEQAIRNKQLNVVRWLVEQGCQLTSDHLDIALKLEDISLMRLLAEHGVPYELTKVRTC